MLHLMVEPLFKSDQETSTDSSATFDQARDEYYIDFTPTQRSFKFKLVNFT